MLVAGTIAAGIVLSVVIRLLRDRKRQKRASCCGGCARCSKHAAGVLSGN
ncbi:MAG: FeoB-associated Cys-rich membrane protein [Desulfovibrio sp.]|nr:FeoB-associated Cys-rich membrane protein [Desulfovibrio sp.]